MTKVFSSTAFEKAKDLTDEELAELRRVSGLPIEAVKHQLDEMATRKEALMLRLVSHVHTQKGTGLKWAPNQHDCAASVSACAYFWMYMT